LHPVAHCSIGYRHSTSTDRFVRINFRTPVPSELCLFEPCCYATVPTANKIQFLCSFSSGRTVRILLKKKKTANWNQPGRVKVTCYKLLSTWVCSLLLYFLPTSRFSRRKREPCVFSSKTLTHEQSVVQASISHDRYQ
jgi:hypothetical protein